ncbi:MAG: FAD binding domain-containing protein, partial [Deltaproteobacteria bacterium]|nr:FAD binding domain-containing protein [Deltaproteobacteria bacterium]
PLRARAAGAVGYNQLRNMATLGGNICLDSKCTYFNQSALWWQSRPDCFKRGGDTCYVVKGGKGCFALSSADTVSALIALDAELVVWGNGEERRIAVEEFYTGEGQTPHRLNETDVLTAVRIPPPEPGWQEEFMKKCPRGAVDFATATLSVRLRGNGKGIEDAKIALNSVSTRPVRAKTAENYLIGKIINDGTVNASLKMVLKDLTPISLVGASASHRRNIIAAMYEDLIAKMGFC